MSASNVDCILFKFPGSFSKKVRKRKKSKRFIFEGTNQKEDAMIKI